MPAAPLINITGPGPYHHTYWPPKDGTQVNLNPPLTWTHPQAWMQIVRQGSHHCANKDRPGDKNSAQTSDQTPGPCQCKGSGSFEQSTGVLEIRLRRCKPWQFPTGWDCMVIGSLGSTNGATNISCTFCRWKGPLLFPGHWRGIGKLCDSKYGTSGAQVIWFPHSFFLPKKGDQQKKSNPILKCVKLLMFYPFFQREIGDRQRRENNSLGHEPVQKAVQFL